MRTCQSKGCQNSLSGKRVAAKWCSSRCASRARRQQNPGPTRAFPRQHHKCQRRGCTNSLEGKRSDAKWCPTRCTALGWRSQNPGRQAHLNRKFKYNLGEETYESLLHAQGHACAICEKIVPLVVDHDHETGEVRGLLCRTCNLGIGYLQDLESLCSRAATYLANPPTRHRSVHAHVTDEERDPA